MDESTDYTYTRDASQPRFVAHHGTDTIGFMSFIERGDELIIDHTVVDDAYQGRGVAAELVEYALNELDHTTTARIVPACSFVQLWLRRHPEKAHLTTRGTVSDANADATADASTALHNAERIEDAKATPTSLTSDAEESPSGAAAQFGFTGSDSTEGR